MNRGTSSAILNLLNRSWILSLKCSLLPNSSSKSSLDASTREDLIKIFGLSTAAAETVSKLQPNARPRTIDDYRALLGDAGVTALKRKLENLSRNDFALVREDAAKIGNHIKDLSW